MKKKISTLLVILILVVVGFFGWSWLHNRDNTPQTKPNTSQQPSDPSEGGKYLVIKEWSVRFALPGKDTAHGSTSYRIIGTDNNGAALTYTDEDLEGSCSLSKDYISKYGEEVNTGATLLRSDTLLDITNSRWPRQKVLNSKDRFFYLEIAPGGCVAENSPINSAVEAINNSAKNLKSY